MKDGVKFVSLSVKLSKITNGRKNMQNLFSPDVFIVVVDFLISSVPPHDATWNHRVCWT